MNKEDLAIALSHIKLVSEKLMETQDKAIKALIERTEKKIDAKINAACKRLTENTIEEIKERFQLVNESERLHKDIKDLKRITEDLIDKHTMLTEIAYLGRQRLDVTGQAKLNAELIKSMDYKPDWFKRRNNMSLNDLFNLYKNGVNPDVDSEE